MDNTYNGWTNRETWLINVWYNPETLEDLDYIREELDWAVGCLRGGGGIVANNVLVDMLGINEINWRELEEHVSTEVDI
jgi:hypothetical protein